MGPSNTTGYDTKPPSSSQGDVFVLAGYRREDFSVCVGCRICASVCTVNDLGLDANPQDLLAGLFLGREARPDDALVRYCTSCYRCTAACPWNIRIPDIVRALRESLDLSSPFERAFRRSVARWGRVYEPYVFLASLSFLISEGYIRYMTKWKSYVTIHLPHRVRRR